MHGAGGCPTEFCAAEPLSGPRQISSAYSAAEPQRSVPGVRSLSVIAAVPSPVRRRAVPGGHPADGVGEDAARWSSRGEQDAHGALPRRLHGVWPLDLHITRSLTVATSASPRRTFWTISSCCS